MKRRQAQLTAEQEPLLASSSSGPASSSDNQHTAPHQPKQTSQQPQSQQQPQQQNQRTRQNKPPTRTTKISQKLVVFPGQYQLETGKVTDVDSEYGGGIGDRAHLVQYSYDVAKEKEAERIRRLDKQELPRVTS